MTPFIIILAGLGLALFGRICYSWGVAKGYRLMEDKFHARYLNRLKAQSQTRGDGEKTVFRG